LFVPVVIPEKSAIKPSEYGDGVLSFGGYIQDPGIVWFPLWLLTLLFLIVLLGFLVRSYRRVLKKREAGLCIKCDYDLRCNSAGICPECGTPICQEQQKILNGSIA
jgi:hypothetical protein